jgi:hypothetical protein
MPACHAFRQPRLTALESRITPDTYTVATLADSGPGSFRQAILSANANAGADVIVFDPSVFAMPQTILLTSGAPQVADALTITGPAAGVTLKNTTLNDNVLDIWQAPAGSKMVFSNLTFTGGTATGGLTAGLYADDQDLTLVNCVFTGNTAQSGVGAVSTVNGPLTLIGCTIANNKGTIGGGVTSNGGTLVILNCAITGNTSTQNAGGGVRFNSSLGSGTLTVRNSTIANNSAATAGGGIGLSAFSGTATIQNCTITGNAVTGTAVNGGGVGRFSGTGGIALESCIVAGNTSTLGPDIGTAGPVTANACAIGEPAGFKLTSGSNNLPYQPLANLKLGPLADNGGPTQTIALLAGSPCLDVGANPAALTTDQRGPGFARTSGGGTDIGAFERPAAPPTVTLVRVNDGSAQRSVVTQLTVEFSEAVSFAGGVGSAFALVRVGPGAPGGAVNLDAVQAGNQVTLAFLDGGAIPTGPLHGLIDGSYQLRVIASEVQGASGPLDGNGDGTGGDDFITPTSGPGRIHRLFGDSDGDGDVDAQDFAAFRGAFGNLNPVFDADGDGDVDAADFGAFRSRFGSSV